ncbi:DUF3299 domain-containing protein [Roseateles sp.]|uniref:DUF3299 domain-containing protein n=1 Tax=Roseateles sp. TaxID=1971397 RepID=UPI00286CD0A2|nr:DUF3299 domain-containing protein [Roseateles sp.]
MKNLTRIAATFVLLALGFGTGVSAQPSAAASGAGYHDPRSPIKPLQERAGVLAWALLSSVSNKVEKNKLIPIFPAQVQALDKKKVKVQGFMMPLEPGDKQQHFLLSAVPTSCAFCVPAGPEGLIEVRSKQPVRYSLEPIVMEGQLAVLSDDPYGMYYRLLDGQEIKP